MGKKKNKGLSQIKAASIRGRQSEENARRVLKELFQMGLIERFRQTDRGSFEDRCGIDFYFTLSIKGCRIDIPLQVKSSVTGILEHERKKLNIKVVNGQAPDLKEHIKTIIQEYQETFDGHSVLEAMEFDEKGKLSNKSEIDQLTNQHLGTYKKEEREQMSSLTLVREPEPEIEMIDGQALTSSKNVAEVFGREHKTVLDAIRNLECSPEFNRQNFLPIDYTDARGRSQPMHLMTFDGFTFLAMGFTGSKAAQFKEQYIKAFNDMRQKLMTVQAAPAPVELSRKDLIMLALKSEEDLEEERKLRIAREVELDTVQSEKAELEEETQRHMEISYQLASEVAAAEQMLREDIGHPVSVAVNFISKPGAVIPTRKMFDALVDKGFITRKRKERGSGFDYFPYASYRNDERPWFFNRPDYVDTQGRTHSGTLLITPIGLMKTYKAICDFVGIPFDPNIQEQLRKRVYQQQQRLSLYQNSEDTPPAA